MLARESVTAHGPTTTHGSYRAWLAALEAYMINIDDLTVALTSVTLTESQTADYEQKTSDGAAYRRRASDAAIATSRYL